MTQAMNTPKRDSESALPDPEAERVTNSLPPDGQNRRNDAQKNLATGRVGASLLQISYQCRGDRVGQGEIQRVPGFRLIDMNLAGVPIDVIQPQAGNIAPPQAVRRDEQENDVIAQAAGTSAIDRLEQSRDGFPRQYTWQVLQTIGSGRVNLAVQSRRYLATQGEESQETAKLSSDMLKCAPAEPTTRVDDETLDVGLGKIGQPKGGIRINLETQQLPGRMRMLINSDRRQPLTSIRCLR